jgi:hypothetical protein
MCDTLQPEELLVRGEIDVVFAHAAGCRACQNTLLEHGVYPPGCDDPMTGHSVLCHLDTLAGDTADPALTEHAKRCGACRLEVLEARAILDDLPPGPGASAPDTNARLRLRCAHCEDHVPRTDAASCASCSTPHHAPCFDRRGSCGVCGDRRYVRTVARPRTFPRWLLGGLLVFASASSTLDLATPSRFGRALAPLEAASLLD